MTTTPGRPAIALLLPAAECAPVTDELRRAGFDPIAVADSHELEALLATRLDVRVGVLDMDGDPDDSAEALAHLHARGSGTSALLVVSAATLDRMDLSAPGHEDDEYLTRPYSAESIRWRVEAMVIRATTAAEVGDDSTHHDGDWTRRGQLVAVFNPKGGVGKTTISVNLATAIVSRGKRVLLVDADTVTGHVPSSLGMDGVPSVVDSWRDELDGGTVLSFEEQASLHASGLKILPLSSSPIHTEILDPERVSAALVQARRTADVVIVDLHPSYSPLNRAILDAADRILMPVTPDLPAIRAAVKFVEVAEELGMRDRLGLVINRANSGVSVADLEKTTGLPAVAQIRSGGMLMVKAVNEGRALVEMAPREKITADFATLADSVLGVTTAEPGKSGLRLFGRQVVSRA
jgi:pilus assembly protein CpaE